jgi:hypothetical protein
MFSQEQEMAFRFLFNLLVDEDVLKLFGVEWHGLCGEAKSVVMYDLWNGSIAIKDMNNLLRQIN